MNLEEAAAYIGMTPAELLRSFHRGLPPGSFAKKIAGELYWDPALLLPPPAPKPVAKPAPKPKPAPRKPAVKKKTS